MDDPCYQVSVEPTLGALPRVMSSFGWRFGPHTKATALRSMSSDASMYPIVVEMFRCPMARIKTRTPTPLELSDVANERRPL